MRVELPTAELDELIREAQGEACAAVKARLRAQFERSLTEQVDARLAAARPQPGGSEPVRRAPEGPEPAAANAGDGLWLYCIAREGEAPDAPGVVAEHAPRIVRAAGLSAIVSSVALSDFGEEGLKRNLNDMPWLEAVARAHEAVLEAALAGGPIVPMRLCTIYRSEEQVQALLAQRREEFTEALAGLRGRGEWGVKVVASRDHVAEKLRQRVEQRPAGAGGAYLGRKQRELRLRDEVDAVLDAAVQESHARLEEWAVASKLLPPQRTELSGRAGEMVLNGAYLVDDERLEGFREVVGELGRQYEDSGLVFDLTGPWPAFNFVGDAA
jgi:hypothetical protein